MKNMHEQDICYCVTVNELFQMTGTQIANRLKSFRKGMTSDSEYQSWRRSLPVFAAVLHEAGLDALTLALEYETPIGSRIDAVLLGQAREDKHPLALIVELKQWSFLGENHGDMESMVSVCISVEENRFENRLHPVQQTLTYAKHLKRNHSNVAAGKIDILCCQFLHNFENKQQLFEGNYTGYAPCENETYVKGDEEKLAAYLKATFSPAPNQDGADLFLDGTYVLGECGFEDLKRVFAKEENAAMIDDQIEVNKKICRTLERLKTHPEQKELIVISGAPGTGKTVVGLHIVFAYCKAFGSTGKNDGKCIFSLPRSRTLAQVITGASGIAPVYLDRISPGRDMVVIDEAHRIEDLDRVMSGLFAKAGIIVVLQDDRQRIRLSEEGTRENFRRFAKSQNLMASEFCLVSQKRAGYLGNYVSGLDRLLYDRCDEPIPQQSGVEVVCWDSLHALDRHLHQLRSDGNRVKWYAPFCWAWSKSVQKRDISIQTEQDVFEKPWNPMEEQYRWYQAETAEALEQVGCIYTAQGLEFDYIGVIWWSDLRWDKQSSDWKIDLNACQDQQFIRGIVEFYRGKLLNGAPPWEVRDRGGTKSIDLFLQDNGIALDAINELVLNTYRVLLTRAKKGVHIWFKDDETEKHFRKVMEAGK